MAHLQASKIERVSDARVSNGGRIYVVDCGWYLVSRSVCSYRTKSQEEFRLLNEADVYVSIQSESTIMLFCRETVCIPLQDP